MKNKTLSKLSGEDAEKANDLVEYLYNKKEVGPFYKPVAYKKLGLDDYPSIIKKPMDLGTVRRKLKKGLYSSKEELYGEINLIWENCRTYNAKGSEIVELADKMQSHTEKYSRRINFFEEPEYYRKVELVDRVRKMPEEVLEEVMDLVESECPHSIKEIEGGRVQIHVDVLNKATFDKLWKMTERLPAKRARS